MLRPATAADLDACAAIWREAIADYQGRLNQPPPTTDLSRIRRLHGHMLATDPERFVVDERPHPGTGDPVIVAFGAAVERGRVVFLSMLFVRPGHQGAGTGRAILDRILPPLAADRVLATATDSAQPISNGLYARLGIPPRMPLWPVVGRPPVGWEPPGLPDGFATGSLADVDPGEIDALDREVLGFDHPADHAFMRSEGSVGIAHRDASGRLAGYAYAGVGGRFGPVAVRDAAILPAVVGHAVVAVEPRGASLAWVPGAADGAWSTLLDAGFRLDGFPILVCWSDAFADFGRYLPISPGLL